MVRLAVMGAIVAALLLAVSLTGGAPINGAEPQGDIARGRAIFEETTIEGTPGCGACHALQPGVALVGPSLAGTGTRARALLAAPGYRGLAVTPEQVLREAILTRDCALWGGSRHLMIPEWEGVLGPQQVADLAAVLASLR